MLRQRPDDRPESIGRVKRALIGHQQDYVTRQRLDTLRNEVVPTTQITDPLAITPLRVVDVDWVSGTLTLVLSDEVNRRWIQAFQSFRWKQAMAPPRGFAISGHSASITAPEHLTEQIIGEFREWLPLVTEQYRTLLENELRQQEARQREEMQAEQEQLERRRRLRGLL
jgi:hypothetical protein